MTSQLVFGTIRRSNRNRMIWSVLGLSILLAVGVLCARYITNFFAGPRDADHAELLTLENPETVDRYWVNVQGDDVYETGIQEITTGRYGRESVSANYQALLVGDRLLLVAAKEEAPAMSYSGALVPIEDEVRVEVVDYVEQDADIEGAFLPYMLDAHDFRFQGYIGFGVGALVLAFSVFGLATALQRMNVAKHPVVKRLARHGDTATVVSDVENELLAPRWSHRKLQVTRNWLVLAKPADFHAMRLNEVVWLYKQITQRRYNGIPAGKTYAVHICDSHGQKIEATGKNEQDLDTMIDGVYAAAPWALVGYNQEIEQAWKSNRNAVVEAVVQRQQQPAVEV